MKSKFWTLVSMVFASAALMACSDDDVVSDPTTGGGTDDNGAYSAYVTVALSMPESTDTRAQSLEGDLTEAGTKDERDVKKIYIYAFEKPTEYNPFTGYTDDDWTLTETVEVSGTDLALSSEKLLTDSVYCYGTARFKKLRKSVEGTTYHILVSVNGKAKKENGQCWPEDKTTTMKVFLEQSRFDIDSVGNVDTEASSATYGLVTSYTSTKNVNTFAPSEINYATSDESIKLPTSFKDGIVMASRAFPDLANTGAGNVTTPYANLIIYNANSETNPAQATVAVERVVARLDLYLTNNYNGDQLDTADDINGTNFAADPYATVTLDKFMPINLSKQSYLFRHKATSTDGKNFDLTDGYEFTNLTDLNGSDWNSVTGWAKAEYVVDPFTATKNVLDYSGTEVDRKKYGEMLYNPLHTTSYTTQTNPITNDTKTTYKINQFDTLTQTKNAPYKAYCLENTTLAQYQLKDYSTGILFSAKFEPQDTHIYVDYKDTIRTLDYIKTKKEAYDALDKDSDYKSAAETAWSEVEAAQKVVDEKQAAYDQAAAELAAAEAKLSDAKQRCEDNGVPTEGSFFALGYTEEQQAYRKAYEQAKEDVETTQAALDDTGELSVSTLLAQAKSSLKTKQEEYKKEQDKVDLKGSGLYLTIALSEANSDLLFYNYNFYASLDALQKAMTLPTKVQDALNNRGFNKSDSVILAEIDEATGKSNIQLLNEYGVTYFPVKKVAKDKYEYRTYYLYILKHYTYSSTSTNQDITVMSPMKFAVVRNNVYRMEIGGVLGLGSGSVDPTDPDPNDNYHPGPNPDEEKEIYLKMELQIRHWVLRDQGTIKLK